MAGLQLVLLTSCAKYTDIKTQGQMVSGKLDNYTVLMNGYGNFDAGPAAICDLASDDVQLVDGSTQQKELAGNTNTYGYYVRSYTWQPAVYEAATNYADYTWLNLYNTIFVANTIIQEVPSVTDGTAAQKAALIAQALVHRADAYLSLVNVYAKPYIQSTAGSDLGVPLVLSPTTAQVLNRASVQTVYSQIITDLKEAIPYLPQTQSMTFIPAKASGFGVLARCYFYMNMYDSAARYADSALAYKSTLKDLSTLTSPAGSNPVFYNSPELLLSKSEKGYSIATSGSGVLRLSDTLVSVLGPNDQRLNLFTTSASVISTTSNYTDAGGYYLYMESPNVSAAQYGGARNTGVSVPEMMLIKAEYYARNNDATNAMLWVNKLRVKRIKAGSYADLTAANADDALVKVIQERQREFFCRMLRWWDMRRLKSDSRFQRTLTRSFNGTQYTLAPNSDRYVFRIAEYYRSLNPEIEQNP
ncbi:hypothetical protein FLA_4958 [Filimonas lacunae]|nr:hypothetical protein FLA_4958 [Filimonas lacunae]